MNDPQPSTPTLVQHGFTVAANDVGEGVAPAASTTAGTSAVDATAASTATPTSSFPSVSALGAALASADADEEEEADASESYDAFGSDEEEGGEEGTSDGVVVDVVGTRHRTPAVRALARSVARGLRSSRARQPTGPSPEGLGGSYVFCDERGRPAAIVKPCDEEPLAPNNPKGFVGRRLGDPGLKPTVKVGQAALREVAAYLLDHGGFARVPPTVLVRVAHPVFHVAKGSAEKQRRAEEDEDAPASAPAAAPSLLSLSLGGGPPALPDPQQQRRHRENSRRKAGGAGGGGGPSVLLRPPADDGAADAPALDERRKKSRPPPTKLASLQAYVPHDGDAADAGASRFSVRDVHAIGILDVRLLNSDRHAGNLLVRRRKEEDDGDEGRENKGDGDQPSLLARFDAARARAARGGRPPLDLVPIDHGFCLPDGGLEPTGLFLEWLHWPQSSVPFDAAELAYIASLDGDADAALLARELPDLAGGSGGGGCLRALSVSTRLLQRCAASGLTLADIGSLCSRPLVGRGGLDCDGEPSELERLCWGARREVDALRRKAAEAAVERGDGPLSTPDKQRPVGCPPSSLGTPALLSEAPATAAGFRNGGSIDGSDGGASSGADSRHSSPPPPLSAFSLDSGVGGASGASSRSGSGDGSSLLPRPPPQLALPSQPSGSHPEDLLFDFEGAAGQQHGGKEAAAAATTPTAATTPGRTSNSSGSALPSPSLNPTTGGAWSPLFRGTVLLGSSAESNGVGGGGGRSLGRQQHLSSPRSPAGATTTLRKLPPPPPPSPGSYRHAPLGTSVASTGSFAGGAAAATAATTAATATPSSAASLLSSTHRSSHASAAGFARRPATARERLRARALAALGGDGGEKKAAAAADGDDDDDSCPPPGLSSARIFEGLDGDDWAAFVEAFDERVCAALKSGIWRNVAASGGIVVRRPSGGVGGDAAAPGAASGSACGGGLGGGAGGVALGVSCPRF